MSLETSQLESLVSPDLLLQLLRQTIGTRVEMIDCEIGNQHHDYVVLLIQLRHPSLEIVVKLAGPEAPWACPFDRTAMLHRLVATRTTIPMPEVLAVDTSYQIWPWRYFIKTQIPGQEWADVRPQLSHDELADAYRQLGNAAAQLHAIDFPSFGELGVDGSVHGHETYIAALAEHARAFLQNDYLRDLFSSLLERQ